MRCAIICSGPSLRVGDLDAITVPKIGINWAYRATQLDVHVASSGIFIRDHGPQINQRLAEQRFASLACSWAITPHRIAKYMWRDYQAKKPFPVLPDNYDVHEHGWVLAGGAPLALQLAVGLGYNEIMFAGLDLESPNHFYSERYCGWPALAFERAWLTQAYALTQLKEQLEPRGIEITNIGASDIFKRPGE